MAKGVKLPKTVYVWWEDDREGDVFLMAGEDASDVAGSLEHGESRKFGIYTLQEEKLVTRTITVEDKVK